MTPSRAAARTNRTTSHLRLSVAGIIHSHRPSFESAILESIDQAKMPVQDPFQIPNSAQDLPLANDPHATFFLNFIASISPETKQPWCPDVRAALPLIDAAFSADNAPEVGYVHVGQKPEYVNAAGAYCLTKKRLI